MTARFFKSRYSGANKTCVEIAHVHDRVLIRDSKYTGPAAEQPVISVAPRTWPALLELALNRSSGTVDGALTVTVHADGAATLRGDHGAELVYNADEWDAFAKGVADGQFDRP